MQLRKLLAMALLPALASVSLGAASAQEAVPQQPVKLAILTVLTGDAAWIGEEQSTWAQLAVSDFNAETGWNVDLVQVDTELDPAQALLGAESVVADPNILAAVGPAASGEVDATLAAFANAHLAHISPSATNPDLTQQGYETFFRVIPHDDVQGPTDAAFLYNQIGARNLFVLDDQSTYGVGISARAEETFTSLGGEIVNHVSISQDDQDFSALVTSIGASGADAIFYAGSVASQGALLANQMLEQGVEIPLFGTDGFFSPDEFIAEADGATEGAYVSVFAPDIRGLESSAEIVERYIAEHGDSFGSFGPPAYAAAMVALEAMERAYANGSLSRESVAAEIAVTEQNLSVLGSPLAFDENGDVENAAFYIFRVEDGAFVLVSNSDEQTS